MRSSDDFRRVTRRGVRVGRPTVVVYAARFGDVPESVATEQTSPRAVRVGFVVGRGVGNAVIRNRVKRRLRHLAASRLNEAAVGNDQAVSGGVDLVIRALPAAANAGAELATDLDQAWNRVQQRLHNSTDRSAGPRS